MIPIVVLVITAVVSDRKFFISLLINYKDLACEFEVSDLETMPTVEENLARPYEQIGQSTLVVEHWKARRREILVLPRCHDTDRADCKHLKSLHQQKKRGVNNFPA